LAPNTTAIFVKSVDDKMTKNNKPYAWIHDSSSDTKYFSYSQSAIMVLKVAKKTGEMVQIRYEMTDFGAKIHHAEVASDAQEPEVMS